MDQSELPLTALAAASIPNADNPYFPTDTRWSTSSPSDSDYSLNTTTAPTVQDPRVPRVNFIAYSIVANLILVIGIIGNILNLIVLTRPKLKGVMYVYLLGLAVSNLCVLITAIPALITMSGQASSNVSYSYLWTFFGAHLQIPLLNSFMAASVYIIICMTVNRYISIYKPTHFQRIHTFKNAYIAIVFSFVGGCILHVPLSFSRHVVQECPVENRTMVVNNGSESGGPDCTYIIDDNTVLTNARLFNVYLWVSEALLRLGPIITLTILNILIIVRFHRIALKREVLKSGAASQHRGSSAGTNAPPHPNPMSGNGHHHGRLSFSEVNGKLAPMPSGITMSTTVSSSGCSSSTGASSTATGGTTVSILEDRTTCNFHSDMLADPTSTVNGNGNQIVISRAHTPLPSSPGGHKFPMRGTPQRASSRRRGLHNPEERMLVVVLIAIVILFVVCTTPAAFLSIMFSAERKKKFWFAIFRAIANNLELLCFALNFFVYCLCSADIRRAFVDVLFENCLVLYLRSKTYRATNVELATVNGKNYPQNV